MKNIIKTLIQGFVAILICMLCIGGIAQADEANDVFNPPKNSTTNQPSSSNSSSSSSSSSSPSISFGSPSSGKDHIGGLDAEQEQGDVDLDTVFSYISSLIQYIIAIAGTIAIVFLIYFAIKMQIGSGITGDAGGVEQAKKGMKAALVGFVIAISSWFLMQVFLEALAVI